MGTVPSERFRFGGAVARALRGSLSPSVGSAWPDALLGLPQTISMGDPRP